MKIFALPTAVPAPTPDWQNYDREKVAAEEAAHRLAVAEHFRSHGYTGKNTGETVSFSVGDGSAEYMLVEGRTSFLVHLPYGDGYRYPNAAYMPKAAILAQIKSQKSIQAFFTRAS